MQGIGIPGFSFCVLALKALQNSIIFKPLWPIAGPTGGQVWGLKLGINAYSSQASSMVADMSVRGISSGQGGGSAGGYHLPLEGYIKEGETFALSNPDSGSSVMIKYMFTVIDED